MDTDALTAAAGATSANPVTPGFAGLTSDDFLQLLITQLQNQDPTNPTDNEALLGQLSSMWSLQANVELGDTLENFGAAQGLTTAAGLIGRTVTGTDTAGEAVGGTVDRAFVTEGTAYVRVGDSNLKLSDVTDVTE